MFWSMLVATYQVQSDDTKYREHQCQAEERPNDSLLNWLATLSQATTIAWDLITSNAGVLIE